MQGQKSSVSRTLFWSLGDGSSDLAPQNVTRGPSVATRSRFGFLSSSGPQNMYRNVPGEQVWRSR